MKGMESYLMDACNGHGFKVEEIGKVLPGSLSRRMRGMYRLSVVKAQRGGADLRLAAIEFGDFDCVRWARRQMALIKRELETQGLCFAWEGVTPYGSSGFVVAWGVGTEINYGWSAVLAEVAARLVERDEVTRMALDTTAVIGC